MMKIEIEDQVSSLMNFHQRQDQIESAISDLIGLGLTEIEACDNDVSLIFGDNQDLGTYSVRYYFRGVKNGVNNRRA